MFKVLIWSLVLALIVLEIILVKKLIIRLQKRKIKVEVLDYEPPKEKKYKLPIALLITIILISLILIGVTLFPFALIYFLVLA